MKKANMFEAVNHLGKPISLSDFHGKKIWLAFYRYASCPLCNLHINNIMKNYGKIENAGLIFLPVFQSSSQEVRKYAGQQAKNLPFQIICDPEEKLYELYNVGKSYLGFLSLNVVLKIMKAMIKGHLPGKMEGEISRLPSEFIIDENFDIIYRYDGKNIGDHPSLELILEKAK